MYTPSIMNEPFPVYMLGNPREISLSNEVKIKLICLCGYWQVKNLLLTVLLGRGVEKVCVLGSEAINVNLFFQWSRFCWAKWVIFPAVWPNLSPVQPQVCNKMVWICGSIRWERVKRAANSSGVEWGYTKYRGKRRMHLCFFTVSDVCLAT